MTMYTIILFYSDGSTEAHKAENITDTSAIEAGILQAWYEFAMKFPNLTRKRHLTGMVIINNMRNDVIENKTYVRKGENKCHDLS